MGTSAGVSTLATFRCQETSNRVQMRLRTIEGQQGELTAFIMNRHAPRSASVVRVPIRPLSLHHRILEPLASIETQLDAAWADYHKAYLEDVAGMQ
jgi:hypothetical protein